MAINFPDSPSNGDTYTVGDKTWTWDGTAWNVVVGGIPTTIDTLTINQDAEVDGILTANHIHGNIAGSVYLHVKNTSGSEIAAGTPVYATGSVGASGATEVSPSDASTAATMPALGITQSTLAVNAEGHATVLGVLGSQNTGSYTVNDSLYVAPGGGLTTTRPTAATDLVQKIARVVRADASTGELLVLGAGRTNDVPNEISILGDLTVDTDTLHVDSTNDRVGIGTTSPSQELDVNGDIVMPVGNGIMFDRSGSDVHVLYKETPGSSTYGAADDVILRNPNGARVRFQTNGTNDRMVITNTGNVGIGTASPSTLLHVTSGTSGDAEVRIAADTDNNAEGDLPYLTFAADGGILEGVVGLNDNTLVLANSVTSGQGIEFRTGATNYYTNGADVVANTTRRMLIDLNGHVTMPYQPCFHAYISGTNPTRGAGWTVVPYNAEVFDNNGDFNTSNSRFVAPVTGRYQFNTNVSAYNIDTSQNATQLVIALMRNGSEIVRLYQSGQYTSTNSDRNRSGAAVISMAANDYVEVRVYSADTSWQLSAGTVWNSFSGFLIG